MKNQLTTMVILTLLLSQVVPLLAGATEGTKAARPKIEAEAQADADAEAKTNGKAKGKAEGNSKAKADNIDESAWKEVYDRGFESRKRGKLIESEHALLEAVKLAEQLPQGDEYLIQSLDLLADLYIEQFKSEKAEPVCRRALALSQKKYGLGHLKTVKELDNLRQVLEMQEHFEQAERTCKEAIAIRERELGYSDPLSRKNRGELACVFAKAGDPGKAERMYEKIREECRGTESTDPHLPEFIFDLGGVYRDQGKYAEAQTKLEQALELEDGLSKPDNPNHVNMLRALGDLYELQEKYHQAETLLERALTLAEKTYGPDHLVTAQVLNSLAVVYLEQAKREPHLRQQEGVKLNPAGLTQVQLVSTRNTLMEKAEPLYLRAHAIREKSLGLNHPDVTIGLNNLGVFYDLNNNRDLSEKYYRRALESMESLEGDSRFAFPGIISNLAGIYKDQNRYKEAEDLFARAKSVAEKKLGLDHPEVANLYRNQGALYAQEGRYQDAIDSKLKAVSIKEKALGAEHRSLSPILYEISALYFYLDKAAEVESYLKRALS
ncbi:MAG: tetratricopeptide repeat protein, partial [Candidatus Obscuribacterales bacterium]|nr:tetratricopeptide repeat protein [Candidatus Obscuribacterales bacterium]